MTERARGRVVRVAAAALLLLLAACGGGGGGGAEPPPPAQQVGRVVAMSLRSTHNGFTYPIEIYLPESYAAGGARYPVIYATESDAPYGTFVGGSGFGASNRSRFTAFKEAMQRRGTQAILVGVGGTARRGTDFLLPGAVDYTRFLAQELAPAIDREYRTDPARRALSGLSHGGYYVVAALVLEASTGTPSFSHYLSTESSFGGHGNVQEYLAFERELDRAGARSVPVVLFLAGAKGFNQAIADAVYLQMAAHAHPGLTLALAEYATTHVGADLPAFEEALVRYFTN
jgi:hypothetical protein